jgi:hypothetical protein
MRWWHQISLRLIIWKAKRSVLDAACALTLFETFSLTNTDGRTEDIGNVYSFSLRTWQKATEVRTN